MKILSCGAGMRSSALHLMSCENALAKKRGEPPVWPQVPIYDISIFCDLNVLNTAGSRLGTDFELMEAV